MRTGPIVTIDGPSGSGKSTLARGLAEELGVPHIDTGALYRAATLAALRAGVDLSDAEACAVIARSASVERRGGRTLLDGQDVEEEIRGPEVTAAVSTFAAHAPVREAMVPVQRAAAIASGGVVEGRDIGTVVLPDADFKIWLTASVEVRARRRADELGADPEEVARDLARRDAADSARETSPLTRPEGSWEVDTSAMSPEETVQAVASLVRAVWSQDATAEAAGWLASGDDPDGDEHDVVDTSDELTAAEPVDEDGRSAGAEPETAREAAVSLRERLPRVAIVGRPNVGKSTLVNRIIGHRAAIVEQRPGVTRDRTEHLAEWLGRPFIVVDTGGWEHAAEGMSARIVEQAERAVEEADLVVFVVDVTVGALEDDELYARLLRRGGRPVVLAANKADSPKQDPYVHELYGLGLGDPHAISAAHGRGVGDLLDEVIAHLPDDAPSETPDEGAIPRVAIVGRPNVGKSSLFNRLVGQERSIVDSVPHTTRDSVDTVVDLGGEPWIFVDTAGLRRRYRHGEETELYSVDRTRRAIEAAHLVLFVLDASEPLGEQDQRLAAAIRDAGCGIVIVLNKWDQVDEDRRHDLEREIDRLLHFAAWAPRLNVSALTGRGLARLPARLQTVWGSYNTRVPTGELNAFIEEVVEDAAPPPVSGRTVRVRYVTQVRAAPPTFLVFANGPLADSYRRYLERRLRERYGFEGSPILIEERGRARSSDPRRPRR